MFKSESFIYPKTVAFLFQTYSLESILINFDKSNKKE